MSMKNSHDTIGNRNRDPTACGTVLQPTAPPRISQTYERKTKRRLQRRRRNERVIIRKKVIQIEKKGERERININIHAYKKKVDDHIKNISFVTCNVFLPTEPPEDKQVMLETCRGP
jgi:hypothetical protein